jgi:hypothetical protein
MRFLLGALIAWCIAPAMPATARFPQEPDQGYRTAYLQSRSVIEANPALGDPFWLQTDVGPPALRSAVENVLSFGPNLVPFLVDEFRREADRMRLYRLMLLLNRVSGINLYFNSGHENFYDAVPEFKARFLSEWDAGNYANASVLLRSAWKDPHPGMTVEKIDPNSITQVRRNGVFAVPFIAESLEQGNSAELFAAFLIITGETALYAEYIEHPSRSFLTHDQKLLFVKGWAGKNEKKVDRLKDLHEKIRSLAIR